jgi:hypothetical protein
MVNDPVKAFMSPEVTDMLDKHAYYWKSVELCITCLLNLTNFLQMRTAVKNVAKFCPTAVVSGRSLEKVWILTKLNTSGS